MENIKVNQSIQIHEAQKWNVWKFEYYFLAHEVLDPHQIFSQYYTPSNIWRDKWDHIVKIQSIIHIIDFIIDTSVFIILAEAD